MKNSGVKLLPNTAEHHIFCWSLGAFAIPRGLHQNPIENMGSGSSKLEAPLNKELSRLCCKSSLFPNTLVSCFSVFIHQISVNSFQDIKWNEAIMWQCNLNSCISTNIWFLSGNNHKSTHCWCKLCKPLRKYHYRILQLQEHLVIANRKKINSYLCVNLGVFKS